MYETGLPTETDTTIKAMRIRKSIPAMMYKPMLALDQKNATLISVYSAAREVYFWLAEPIQHVVTSTYDRDSADNLFRWDKISHDHLVDEVGCQAEDNDQRHDLHEPDRKEGQAQRRSTIGWNSHFARSALEVGGRRKKDVIGEISKAIVCCKGAYLPADIEGEDVASSVQDIKK